MENNETKKSGLVQKIMNFLKLGDEGKIGNFFERQIRNLNTEITALESNIKSIEFNSNNEVSNYEYKLEDARPENVATNKDQDAFAVVYWDNIEECESEVEKLEERIKNEKERTSKSIEDIEKQIKERKVRISKIS